MRSLLSLGKYWAIEPDTFNNLEALVSKDAPVLENTRTVRIQNGVAVIPQHRGHWWKPGSSFRHDGDGWQFSFVSRFMIWLSVKQ